MKKVIDWLVGVLTSHYEEAVAAGICDFSGQGRDKYGN